MKLISREEVLKAIGNVHPLDFNMIGLKSRIEKIPVIAETYYCQGDDGISHILEGRIIERIKEDGEENNNNKNTK